MRRAENVSPIMATPFRFDGKNFVHEIGVGTLFSRFF